MDEYLSFGHVLDLSGYRAAEVFALAQALSQAIGEPNPYCLQYDSWRPTLGQFKEYWAMRRVILWLLERTALAYDAEVEAGVNRFEEDPFLEPVPAWARPGWDSISY